MLYTLFVLYWVFVFCFVFVKLIKIFPSNMGLSLLSVWSFKPLRRLSVVAVMKRDPWSIIFTCYNYAIIN